MSIPSLAPNDEGAKSRIGPSPVIIALGLAAGPVVALGFTRFAYALLLPSMRSTLDWSFTAAGGITTTNAIGYIIGAATTGLLARRFGDRTLFIAAMIVSAVMLLLTAASGDYVYLTVVRFIGGFFTAAVFVVGSSLAARIQLSSGKKSASMVGIYMAGVGVGIVLSGVAVPAVLSWLGQTGWPAGWLILGALASLAVWPTVVASKYVSKAARTTGPAVSMKFLTPTFIWYLFFGAGYVSYLTFVIALLADEGLTAWTLAAFFIVLGVASVLGTLFVWGGLIARLKSASAQALITLVVAVGVVPVLLWPGIGGAFVSALIFGSAFMAGPSAATVVVRRTLPVGSSTVGIAALTTAFSIGQAIGPVASGAISDTSFGIQGGLWLSVVLLVVADIAILFQRAPRSGALR
jgi:predicted MFS family arabinose efflux permease